MSNWDGNGGFSTPGLGFIGTPNMNDIRRLEKRIEDLEKELREQAQYLKGYIAGTGGGGPDDESMWGPITGIDPERVEK